MWNHSISPLGFGPHFFCGGFLIGKKIVEDNSINNSTKFGSNWASYFKEED